MTDTDTPVQDQPSQEVFAQLVQNQTRELELKARELALQVQQDNHNYQFAIETLKVKASGQAVKLEHERKTLTIKAVAWTLALLVVGCLIGVSVLLGAKDVASDIIKAIAYLGAGGVGGYGYGRLHQQAKDHQPS